MANKSSVKQYRDKGDSLHAKDSKEYKLVQRYMDILEYAYERFKSTLDRLQALHLTYENVVNETMFPTISKMAIPNHFGMVQEALPDALDFIWPDSLKTYELNPVDTDVDMETLDKVERGLNYFVRQRIDAKWASLPILTNAIKTGLGYGAVIPHVITPPATINKRFIQGGRVVGSARSIGVGKPQKTLILKNIPLGQIIPSDDGSDFNGPDSASYIFWIDVYGEDRFRRLMKKVKADAEDIAVSGDAEAIIQQAYAFNFTTNVPLPNIISSLGGVDLTTRGVRGENEFVQVPVIKCYGEHEVVWIANGTTVIYHEKDSIQTLHRPLIKASVTVDNSKWHPMNPAEAGAAIANGKNIYTNLLMDMIIRATNPIAMYDKGRFGNKPPVPGVNGWIGVDGVTTGAIDFPSTPQMNNGHFGFDNMLDRLYGHAVGQASSMQEPTPGMLRGGMHAFESLLNTMSGRKRLAAMVMEMGFVKPLGNIAMIHMQLMASGEGMSFQEREYDSDVGKDRIAKHSITFDDLQHAYSVTLDTRVKSRSTTDLNERIQIFNMLRDDPYFDPHGVREWVAGPYSDLRRSLYSREKVRKIQEQQAAQQAAEATEQASPNNIPGGTVQNAEAGAIMGGA